MERYREKIWPALEHFTKALAYFKRLKDTLGLVSTHIHLGEIACEQKQLDKAQKHFQTALQLVLSTQCRPLLTDALGGVARLMKARGEGRKAIGLLMVALSHPTCRKETKDHMVSMGQSLEANFSAKEKENGFLWAKDFTLEEMATSWLKSLSPKRLSKS